MKNLPLQAHNGHRPDAVDTAATKTFPKGTTLRKLDWSYSDTPDPECEIKIVVNGVQVWSQYVTAAGPGFHEFTDDGVNGDLSGAIVVTLDAGGAAVKGQFNAILGPGI